MVRSVVSNARWAGRAAALVAAMAAAVWLVMLVAMPEEADARSRYKTVTKTFSNPTAITIPSPSTTSGAASDYPSTVAAGGMRRGKILDANVTLRGYTHTWPEDVDVLLVGPRGQNALIMSDVVSFTDVIYITLGLDDEAEASLTDSGLASGTFKPINNGAGDTFPAPAPTPSGAVALSTFDGANPNGTWSLYVFDDASSDTGNFAGGWSITIRAKVLR